MNEEEVEKRSLEDLDRIINAARELGISLVLIGGYAVAAYTRGYRYTKDIDLVADKLTIGELKGLLKALGYSIRDTEFGLAGAKNLDGGFIDLHISVGKITDISTGKDYPVNSDLFKNAKRLDVKGYRTNASLKAAVVELETLIVLKLMTVGRDKDAVDLISLLRDNRNEVDPDLLAQRVAASGLTEHMLSRIRDYARRLKTGELDEVWFGVTASRFPRTEKREIGSLFSALAELFRRH